MKFFVEIDRNTNTLVILKSLIFILLSIFDLHVLFFINTNFRGAQNQKQLFLYLFYTHLSTWKDLLKFFLQNPSEFRFYL